MRTITALTLPLCVTLTITDVQAGVQSGGKSNQAQSESVVDYDVPGSVSTPGIAATKQRNDIRN